jgi:hypothetical protein
MQALESAEWMNRVPVHRTAQSRPIHKQDSERTAAVVTLMANPSLNADVPHVALRPGMRPPVSLVR